MAIVSWASLGGGNLATAEQRKKAAEDPDTPKDFYPFSEHDLAVCNAIEELASSKGTTFQSIVRRTPFGPDRPPMHLDTGKTDKNTSAGPGISVPPVHLRLSHCRRADP